MSLYSSELNERERVCISKNEMGPVQTKKNTEDTVREKGCRAWVGHKDELWENVATLLDKGNIQKEEQAESKILGKADTDNTAVEIHFQCPLNAFQKVHSRLPVERCSLIHSL